MLPFPSSRWSYKPPYQFTRLNRAHPLARGLTDMWMFNGGTKNVATVQSQLQSDNLVRPNFPMSGVTGFSTTYGDYGVSPQGIAARVTFNGTAFEKYWRVIGGGAINYCSGDFTIRVVFQPTNYNAATYASIFTKNGSVTRELGLFINSNGDITFVDAGDQDLSITGAGTNYFTLGNTWDLVMTRIGTALTIYGNGKSIATSTATGTGGGFGANTPGDSHEFCLGADLHGGGVCFQANYLLCQIWNRGLTQAEAVALYADRYCVLMPPNTWWSGIVQAAVTSRRPFPVRVIQDSSDYRNYFE